MAWKTVFSKQDYRIVEHPGHRDEANKTLYSVVLPSNDVILGNRSTLEEAKRDLDEYIRLGGHQKFESLSGLMTSQTTRAGLDLDPEIRPLIEDLNAAGYHTTGSCAGHQSVKGYKHGFVIFSMQEMNDSDLEGIKTIMQSHNLKPTTLSRSGRQTTVDFQRR